MKLPNLRSFEIEVGHTEDHDFEIGFLRINPLPLLRSMTLSPECMTTNDILKFMLLRSVERVFIKAMNIHAEDT